jgi:predicted nucleic acid-binding protein
VIVVLDASTVVAGLADQDNQGAWARRILRSDDLVGPHFMPVEVASILRIAVFNGEITTSAASIAHADLMTLPVELYAYEPLALRVWELRQNVSPYDGWYVALAEALDAPLATLDRRLTRSAGPRCRFLVPDG